MASARRRLTRGNPKRFMVELCHSTSNASELSQNLANQFVEGP